ncbi:MAG: hypothetical protein JSS63_01160 [Bacteroidetes bacterium]|nr:hypothetical protein [Bacteroidota bacterium]
MNLKLFFAIIFCISPVLLFSQQDSTPVSGKRGTANPGGIFISPTLSAVYPTGDFSTSSKIAPQFGVRLEYSSKKIYPFVIGALLEVAKHHGKDEFMNSYLLNTYDTKVTSFGGSVDIILSKFLKTNFTIPFATLEAKYINASTTISPDGISIPGVELSRSEFAYGGGLGFTLYIFDIYAKYSYSKSYSTFSVNTRFHFPVVKF